MKKSTTGSIVKNSVFNMDFLFFNKNESSKKGVEFFTQISSIKTYTDKSHI